MDWEFLKIAFGGLIAVVAESMIHQFYPDLGTIWRVLICSGVWVGIYLLVSALLCEGDIGE